MSFDPEKVKEYCINKLKKGNEGVSEGRMRANMANKHIGTTADEVLNTDYAEAELRVLADSLSPQELFDMPDSDLEHLRDDLWKTDGSFEKDRQAKILDEDASEGRMRADLANKYVDPSAGYLLNMGYTEDEIKVLKSGTCSASVSDDAYATYVKGREAQMAEIYPKDKPEPTSWEYYADKPPEDDPKYGSTPLELQFTIHQERFIEVNNMTIDLGIIPLIGYQGGLLTLALVIGEKFEHYPCSESNYEALQAIWMKVRLTGL